MPDASCATRVMNGLFRTQRSVARRVFTAPGGQLHRASTETESQFQSAEHISDQFGRSRADF
jgi:hypothetical protein